MLRIVIMMLDKEPDEFARVKGHPGYGLCNAIASAKLMTGLVWTLEHTDFVAGLRDSIAWYRGN